MKRRLTALMSGSGARDAREEEKRERDAHTSERKFKESISVLFITRPREISKNDGGQYPDPETLTDTWSCVSTPHWKMDAFEGIHVVQLSSSPPPVSRSSPGYEVLVTGSSGIAVYSSHTFFGNDDFSDHRRNKHSRAKERCPVGSVRRALGVRLPVCRLALFYSGYNASQRSLASAEGPQSVSRLFFWWTLQRKSRSSAEFLYSELERMLLCRTAKGIVRVDRPGA
ncbi:hypothetical protein SRHO_G00091180 [Serrasalmus rhombeus]